MALGSEGEADRGRWRAGRLKMWSKLIGGTVGECDSEKRRR